MDQSPHHPSFVLLLPLMIMATSLPFLITCSCLTVAVAAHVPGNETDRLALLAFKDAITSDPLSSLRNWNSTVHPCRWLGVTCGLRHGRVVALDLRGRSLVGTISPHVGNLSFLRVLSLRNNSFTGVIPEEIGRLTRLAHLDVKNNSNIGGGIPANLSRCSRLGLLDLYGNQLVGSIPVELGSLSQLTELRLGANNLHGSIPPSLGNLSSLVRLSLLRNNLEGSIPDDLGRLTRLGFFQVAINNLSGPIPPSLYNLSTIHYFAATDNRLRGSLPSNLGLALPRLEALGLGGNQFSGSIPISLANASRLTIVDLPMNNFRGPVPASLGTLRGLLRLNLARNPVGGSNTTRGDDLSFITSLTNCSSLQGLGVEFCQLEGPLPKSVANFSTRLNVLALGGNRISGSIPMGIGNLVGLVGLGMNGNVLEGTIPSTLGNLRQLQLLLLSKNRISGKIPAALGNLSSLSELHLQENGLEGDIPGSLGGCRHLQLLNLSHNSLEGAIPRQLFGLSSLSISLNLAHNSLSGPLPIEVGSLQNLGELVVSHNGLAGTIPTTLGGCMRLERLYMNENSFEGGIPTSLDNLKIIQELDLSHNNLTGQIPASLGSLQYLAYLNLSYNDLQGRVPKDGVFANSSAISLHGNSRLCGGIPLLEFPTCPTQLITNRRGKLDRVKVAILIPCLVLFSAASTTIFFMLWMRKKSRRKPSPVLSCDEDEHRRVSYAELFRATGGFSPSNLLGVGSYGSVYKGQLDHDQEAVAVKVLNLQQRGALESFLTECKALRSVRHRNLVKVITLCSGVDTKGDDFKALVFEFMSNGTLDEWLHSQIMGTLQHPPKHPPKHPPNIHLNLRKLVESAFPWRVMDIADPSLLMLAESDHSIVSATGDVQGSEQNVVRRMVKDCLVHVIGIGLSCCAELPKERPAIDDIVVELHTVRETLPKQP